MALPFEICYSGGFKYDWIATETAMKGLIPSEHINYLPSTYLLISMINFGVAARVDRRLLNDERCLLSIASPLLPFSLLETPSGSADPYSWILENEVYKSWCFQQKQDLLYLDSQSSTQVASEYIFRQLDSLCSGNINHIALYFTFSRYDVRRCKAENMLATFLAQMSRFILRDSGYNVPNYIISPHGWNYMDTFHNFEVYCLGGSRKISCLINNLDECEPVSRKAFLDSFRNLSERRTGLFKVIATSSKPGALLEELSSWPILDLGLAAPAKMNGEAAVSFKLYLQRQRPEIRGCETLIENELEVVGSLEPEVCELLLGHVSRNEYWPLQKSIEDILGPVDGIGLESAVEKILSNIADKDLVFHTLFWILYAARPLTHSELATATMLGLRRSNMEEMSPTTHSIRRFLRNLRTWLSGIITFEHNTILVSTYGIRRVLIMKLSQSSDDPKTFSQETHAIIARTCLVYLTCPGIKESLDECYENSHYNDCRLAISYDCTTFQNYAVQFWVHHVSFASIGHGLANVLTSFVKSESMLSWSRAYWVLANPFTRSHQPHESLYPILASVGLFEKIESLPNEGEHKSEALIEACANGTLHVFRQLLSRSEYSEEKLIRALLGAGAYGDESLLFELIEYITKTHHNFPWKSQSTIVARMSFLRLNRVLTKLLEVGCPIDSQILGDPTSPTPIRLATQVNNVDGAKVLLERGANPNHANQSKYTCLHIASYRGYPEMVELLVRYGADIDARGDNLLSPLHAACQTGHIKTIKMLVELKANLNIKSASNQNEPAWSSLAHLAMENNAEGVRILLEADADHEISTIIHGTPLGSAVAYGSLDVCEILLKKGANPSHELIEPPLLCWATRPGHMKHRFEIVKLLVEKGVNLNVSDKNGETPLHLACWSEGPDKLSTVEYLLLQGAEVNLRGRNGYTPLHIAIIQNDVRLLQLLLSQRQLELEIWSEKKTTPLILAVENEEMTRMLLEHGAKPNTRSDDGNSALLSAINGNHTNTVRLLIQYGAQIDPPDGSRDDSVWEPMESAVDEGQGDIIRILAEAGADVNRRFLDGSTLIHMGLDSTGLGALLEFRPKLDIKNDSGNAPLHEVFGGTPLENVKLLIRAGSDINLTNSAGKTPITGALLENRQDIARYYLSRKADLNIISPIVGGPLHVACSKGSVDLVKELIEAGADVNLVATEFVGAPLSSIFVSRRIIDSSLETRSELMNILFSAGADPTIMCGYFGSVAGAIAMGGESVHLSMLASKGASLVYSDSMGRKPLHFAAVRGDRNMVSILLNAGAKATEEDGVGRHAISWAAQGGNMDILHDLIQLIGDGSISKPDVDGWTPLYWAIRGAGNMTWTPGKGYRTKIEGGAYMEVIKFLLDQGANPTTKSNINGSEYTPASLARYHSCNDDILQLLAIDEERGQQQAEDGVLHRHGASQILANHQRLRGGEVDCSFCFFVCCHVRQSLLLALELTT